MNNHLLTLIMLFTIILSSCKPDACKDVKCLNGGICESGECNCANGYEGLNCETEQRLAFVGNYAVEESCNLGGFTYEVNVTADLENVTEITVYNLGDFDFEIIGVVDGNSVTFTDQVNNGRTINGSGELNVETLTIDYSLVTDSGQTLTCTAIGLVQE